jgi:integrase
MEESHMPQDRPRRDSNKVKLTDPFIKSLQPQAQPYLVWDTKQRGLAVRVQPSGHKSYKCIYSRHARPRWFSLGAIDIGLAKARVSAAKVLVLVDDGKDPAADKKAERSSGTFGELAIEYRDHAKKKNKSWEQADDLVTRHLLPKWSKLKPADISRSDVKKAVMTRLEATPIQANQVLAAASAIFTWAIEEEKYGVKVNPCSRVKRYDTNSRDRVLSDSEVPKFCNVFDDGSMEGMALKTILFTGQRPNEVTCMHTKHIVDGWWQMPGDPDAKLSWPGTKNSHSHRVWLPAPVQDILKKLEPTGLVFAAPRGDVITNLDKTMREICKALGMKRDTAKGHRSNNPTPQDLRRTFGTKVTGLGFGRDAMDRVLNHKEGDKKKTGKKKVTDVYDRAEYGPQDKIIMETVAANLMMLIHGGGVLNFSKYIMASAKAK